MSRDITFINEAKKKKNVRITIQTLNERIVVNLENNIDASRLWGDFEYVKSESIKNSIRKFRTLSLFDFGTIDLKQPFNYYEPNYTLGLNDNSIN